MSLRKVMRKTIENAVTEGKVGSSDVILHGRFKVNMGRTVGMALLGFNTYGKSAVVALNPETITIFMETEGAFKVRYDKEIFVIKRTDIEALTVTPKKKNFLLSFNVTNSKKEYGLFLSPLNKAEGIEPAVQLLNLYMTVSPAV